MVRSDRRLGSPSRTGHGRRFPWAHRLRTAGRARVVRDVVVSPPHGRLRQPTYRGRTRTVRVVLLGDRSHRRGNAPTRERDPRSRGCRWRHGLARRQLADHHCHRVGHDSALRDRHSAVGVDRHSDPTDASARTNPRTVVTPVPGRPARKAVGGDGKRADRQSVGGVEPQRPRGRASVVDDSQERETQTVRHTG